MKLKFDKTILKQKIGKVPVPVVAIGLGVVAVIAYRKFGGGGAAGASGSSSSGGTGGNPAGLTDSGDTGGPADYSSGSAGGGSVASGGGGGAEPVDFSGYSGGAFVPAATLGTLQQPIVQVARVIKKFKVTKIVNPRKPGNRRRPTVINRIVINQAGIKTKSTVTRGTGRPVVGFGAKPKINMTTSNRSAPSQPNRRRRIGETPPIIRRPIGR